MIRIDFKEIETTLFGVLQKYHFSPEKARLLARIYTQSSCDGVYSHGLNRFPLFIDYVERGLVDVAADPKKVAAFGSLERWDGKSGAGILNAHRSMERAMELAEKYTMGCLALRNTNHWMRGGTYGWQAAEQGKIASCFTNTKPNMPPWGGAKNRLGNNPFVVAIPRTEGHVVLDMAVSQFALGKINTYKLNEEQLPFAGGWNKEGELTKDPAEILEAGTALPMGYWKGSALAMVLDMLAALLANGNPTHNIQGEGHETDLSQVFIGIDPGKFSDTDLTDRLLNEIIDYTHDVKPMHEGDRAYYPGEQTLATRKEHLKNGVCVDASIWKAIRQLS